MEGYLILAKGFHLLDDIMTFLKHIVRSHHTDDIPKEMHSLTVSWLIIYWRSGPDTGYSFVVAL